MDAATLRLILVVIGVVFLIGLYLWEKQRAEGDREPPQRQPSPRRTKQEPNLGRFGDDALEDAGHGHAHDDDADDLSAGEPGAAATINRGSGTPPAPPRREPARASAAAPPPDELLIQLYITSAGDAFAGDDILSAAERCRIYPGDMDIFHRTQGDAPDGEPLFSMANLVKPGTFPFADMTDFSSPGLAVFAQFRGEPSDLMVFDEMLDAAQIMAELLGGDIRGPQREPLRDADAKALRGRVRALLHGGSEAGDTP
jgi:cell division protein ZipA